MTDAPLYTVKPKKLDHRLIWFRKWLVRARKDGMTTQGWDRMLETLDSITQHAAALEGTCSLVASRRGFDDLLTGTIDSTAEFERI